MVEASTVLQGIYLWCQYRAGGRYVMVASTCVSTRRRSCRRLLLATAHHLLLATVPHQVSQIHTENKPINLWPGGPAAASSHRAAGNPFENKQQDKPQSTSNPFKEASSVPQGPAQQRSAAQQRPAARFQSNPSKVATGKAHMKSSYEQQRGEVLGEPTRGEQIYNATQGQSGKFGKTMSKNQDVMGNNLEMANERTERLGQIENNSQELAKRSAGFASGAKALRQQSEKEKCVLS